MTILATPQVQNSAVDEVLQRITGLCAPLAAERVPLGEALHRVLRENVEAREPIPAFDRSAVDGFAIGADDPATTFRIVGSLRAGDWRPQMLQPGEAVEISTGAALPGPGLRVIMREQVRLTHDSCVVLRRYQQNHVRHRGEDVAAGERLLSAGTVLSGPALSLLASLGCTSPLVTRPPRIVHVVTGDEIVAPESQPRPGQIRDSNSVLVAAFLAEHGIAPQQLRLPEARAEAINRLAEKRDALEHADLLLFSGGASVGMHDHTRDLLHHLGFALRIDGAALRPGKPLLVATRDACLAFALPGNPLAHLVALNLFVSRALDLLAGASTSRPFFARAALTVALDGEDNPRETLWPAIFSWKDEVPSLSPIFWKSSGDVTAFARVNALAVIPPRTGLLPADSLVRFLQV